MHGPMNIKS